MIETSASTCSYVPTFSSFRSMSLAYEGIFGGEAFELEPYSSEHGCQHHDALSLDTNTFLSCFQPRNLTRITSNRDNTHHDVNETTHQHGGGP